MDIYPGHMYIGQGNGFGRVIHAVVLIYNRILYLHMYRYFVFIGSINSMQNAHLLDTQSLTRFLTHPGQDTDVIQSAITYVIKLIAERHFKHHTVPPAGYIHDPEMPLVRLTVMHDSHDLAAP